MKEEMKNEIEKYAEKLGVSVEQAQADYAEIVAKHNLELYLTPDTSGCCRSWFVFKGVDG